MLHVSNPPCSESTRRLTAGSTVCAIVVPTSSPPLLTPWCVSDSSCAEARTPAVRSLLRQKLRQFVPTAAEY